jgi:hypothetical protein
VLYRAFSESKQLKRNTTSQQPSASGEQVEDSRDSLTGRRPRGGNRFSSKVRAAAFECVAALCCGSFVALPAPTHSHLLAAALHCVTDPETAGAAVPTAAACKAIGNVVGLLLPVCSPVAQAQATDALVPLLAPQHAPATRVAASWAAANVCHAVMTERDEVEVSTELGQEGGYGEHG